MLLQKCSIIAVSQGSKHATVLDSAWPHQEYVLTNGKNNHPGNFLKSIICQICLWRRRMGT